jgi:hypothetical protein
MKNLANIKLIAAWDDMLVVVVVVVQRCNLLGKRFVRTRRPVGDDGGEEKAKMPYQLQASVWLSSFRSFNRSFLFQTALIPKKTAT